MKKNVSGLLRLPNYIKRGLDRLFDDSDDRLGQLGMSSDLEEFLSKTSPDTNVLNQL